MAACCGHTGPLLTLLLLAAALAGAEAFSGFGRARHHRGSFSFSALENLGCLPENFTVPAEVLEALTDCEQGSQSSRHSSFRFRHHGHRGSSTAATLKCLADSLNITNASGVDETALAQLIDSFSSNTTWTDQQKANLRACISDMDASLTSDQQGVYALACLKKRLLADCLLQQNSTAPCAQAGALTGKLCPVGFKSFVGFRTFWTCKRETMGSSILGMVSALGGLLSGGGLSDGICSSLRDSAGQLANCTLQTAGLASGDAVNLTAVRDAVQQSDASETVKSLQLALLDECEARPVDTVDELLDCWGELAPLSCASYKANQLAQSYSATSTSPFFGRDRFGGGRFGGGRFGGGSSRGGRRRGGRGGFRRRRIFG